MRTAILLVILLLAPAASAEAAMAAGILEAPSRIEADQVQVRANCVAHTRDVPRADGFPVARGHAASLQVDVVQGRYFSPLGPQPVTTEKVTTHTHGPLNFTILAVQDFARASVGCSNGAANLYDAYDAVIYRLDEPVHEGAPQTPTVPDRSVLSLEASHVDNYILVDNPSVRLVGFTLVVETAEGTFEYTSGTQPDPDPVPKFEQGVSTQLQLSFTDAWIDDLVDLHNPPTRQEAWTQTLDGWYSLPQATGHITVPAGTIPLDGPVEILGRGTTLTYTPSERGGITVVMAGPIEALRVGGRDVALTPEGQVVAPPGADDPSWLPYALVPAALVVGLALRSLRRLRHPDLLVLAAEEALALQKPKRAGRLAYRAARRTCDEEAVMLMGLGALRSQKVSAGMRRLRRLERRHGPAPALVFMRGILKGGDEAALAPEALSRMLPPLESRTGGAAQEADGYA